MARRKEQQARAADWDNVDLSTLRTEALKGRLSREDFERLLEFKPQTLLAAKRAGIKEAALMTIYHFVKSNASLI